MSPLTIVAKTNNVLVCEDVKSGRTYQVPIPLNVNIPIGSLIEIQINIILPPMPKEQEKSAHTMEELKVAGGHKMECGQKVRITSSQDDNVFYDVTKLDSKQFECTCPAFLYNPETQCKHCKAVSPKQAN